MKTDTVAVGSEVAKSAPAVTVAGMSIFGFQINEWMYLATFVYVLLQIIAILPKVSITFRMIFGLGGTDAKK